MNNIRNFVIIAHIDHGKSTLADRLLEITGTVEKRLMKPQYLDQLELERERGITIKMAPVRMTYRLTTNDQRPTTESHKLSVISRESSNSEYILNLIDTPGHSDFAYEVSRALAAVEGAVLLVDATQGIQAQTLANFENARKTNLTIIGVGNKIDAASPDQIAAAMKDLGELLRVPQAEILKVSGKTGEGVEQLLAAIIEKVPSPRTYAEQIQTNADKISAKSALSQRDSAQGSRALIFDSFYDEHKGIIAFVRVFDGEFLTHRDIFLAATKVSAKAKEVGYFTPQLKASSRLLGGEIGYVATGIKNSDQLKIGDTICGNESACAPLPGYAEPKPVVFVSLYPEESDKYDEFKQALNKLRLSDAALTLEADQSEVLGRGFKGGFLGRLHFEIAVERLAREFHIATIHSFPSVAYQIKRKQGEDWTVVTNPKDFADDAAEVLEPITRVEILTPSRYLGAILQLKSIFRFFDLRTSNIGDKILIIAKLPLADLIGDLDDKLKSVSEGFASLSYELIGYEKADVIKLEILVAGQMLPGLTRVLPKKDIEREGRRTAEKLKELLPRQQFVQSVQAMAGGRIIARETIPAFRKDVTGYLYGGDRTRKMKLWKKQQRGKKKLKELASQSRIKVPADVFKELLKK